MPSQVWQTLCTHRHDGFDLILGINFPSRRLPRCVTVFIYDANSYAPPPLAPTMVRPRLHVQLLRVQHPRLQHPSIALTTMTTLRTASSTMAIHPRLGYLIIGTKGYHPHEASLVFLQS